MNVNGTPYTERRGQPIAQRDELHSIEHWIELTKFGFNLELTWFKDWSGSPSGWIRGCRCINIYEIQFEEMAQTER